MTAIIPWLQSDLNFFMNWNFVDTKLSNSMLPEFTSTCHRINTYTVLKTNFGWNFLYLANCGYTSFCILGTSSRMCVTSLSLKCLLSNFPSGIPRYANFFHLFGLWFITPHLNLDTSPYTILWAVVSAKRGTVLWAGTWEGAVVRGIIR